MRGKYSNATSFPNCVVRQPKVAHKPIVSKLRFSLINQTFTFNIWNPITQRFEDLPIVSLERETK